MSFDPLKEDRLTLLRQLVTPKDGSVRTPSAWYVSGKLGDTWIDFCKCHKKFAPFVPFRFVFNAIKRSSKLIRKSRNRNPTSVCSAIDDIPTEGPIAVQLFGLNSSLIFIPNAPSPFPSPSLQTPNTSSSASNSRPISPNLADAFSEPLSVSVLHVLGYPESFLPNLHKAENIYFPIPWSSVEAPLSSIKEQMFYAQIHQFIATSPFAVHVDPDTQSIDTYSINSADIIHQWLLPAIKDVKPNSTLLPFDKKLNTKWTFPLSPPEKQWLRTQKCYVWLCVKNSFHALCHYGMSGCAQSAEDLKFSTQVGDLFYKCLILLYIGYVVSEKVQKVHLEANSAYIREVLANLAKRAGKIEKMAENLIANQQSPSSDPSKFPFLVRSIIELSRMAIVETLQYSTHVNAELDKVWQHEIDSRKKHSDVSKYIEALCSNTSSKWFFQTADTVFDVGNIMSSLVTRGVNVHDDGDGGVPTRTPIWHLPTSFGSMNDRIHFLSELIKNPPNVLKEVANWKVLVFEFVTDLVCDFSNERVWAVLQPTLVDRPNDAMNLAKTALNFMKQYITFKNSLLNSREIPQAPMFMRHLWGQAKLVSLSLMLLITRVSIYADETGILEKHPLPFSFDFYGWRTIWLCSKTHLETLQYLESCFSILCKDPSDHLFSTSTTSIAHDLAKHYETSAPTGQSILESMRKTDDENEKMVKQEYERKLPLCQQLNKDIIAWIAKRHQADEEIRAKNERKRQEHLDSGSTKHFHPPYPIPDHGDNCKCEPCVKLLPLNTQLSENRTISRSLRNVPSDTKRAYVMLFGLKFIKSDPVISLLVESYCVYLKTEASVPSASQNTKSKMKSSYNQVIENEFDFSKSDIVLGCPNHSKMNPGSFDVLNDPSPNFSVKPDGREMAFFFGGNFSSYQSISVPEYPNIYAIESQINHTLPFKWMLEVNDTNENRAIASYQSDCLVTMRQNEYLLLGSLRSGGALQLNRLLGIFDGPKISLHQRSDQDIPVEWLMSNVLYEVGPPLLAEVTVSSNGNNDKKHSRIVEEPLTPLNSTPNERTLAIMRQWKSAFNSPTFVASVAHATLSSFDSLRELSQAHNYRLVVSFIAAVSKLCSDDAFPILVPTIHHCIAAIHSKLLSLHQSASKKIDTGNDDALERLHLNIKGLAHVGIVLFESSTPERLQMIANLQTLAALVFFRSLTCFYAGSATPSSSSTFRLEDPNNANNPYGGIYYETRAPSIMFRYIPYISTYVATNPGFLENSLVDMLPKGTFAPWNIEGLGTFSTKCVQVASKVSTAIVFEAMSGEILVEGSAARRLPDNITTHSTFKQVFKTTSFVASAATTNGFIVTVNNAKVESASFVLPQPQQSSKSNQSKVGPTHQSDNSPPVVSFMFMAKHGDVKILETRAFSNGILQRFQLIPFDVAGKHLPEGMITDHSLWVDLDSKLVYFRPRYFDDRNFFNFDKCPYILDLQSREISTTNATTFPGFKLCSKSSKLFSKASKIFYRLDHPDYLRVWVSPQQTTMIDIPRMQLHFSPDATRTKLVCSEFSGMAVDKIQFSGVLVGLQHCLQLSHVNNPELRNKLLIIPNFEIIPKSDHSNLLPSAIPFLSTSIFSSAAPQYKIGSDVYLKTGSVKLNSPSRFVFALDGFSKMVKSPTPSVELFLANLHCQTATSFTEPFTGLTGLESAVICLRRFPSNSALDKLSTASLESMLETIPEIQNATEDIDHAKMFLGKSERVYYEGLVPIILTLAYRRNYLTNLVKYAPTETKGGVQGDDSGSKNQDTTKQTKKIQLSQQKKQNAKKDGSSSDDEDYSDSESSDDDEDSKSSRKRKQDSAADLSSPEIQSYFTKFGLNLSNFLWVMQSNSIRRHYEWNQHLYSSNMRVTPDEWQLLPLHEAPEQCLRLCMKDNDIAQKVHTLAYYARHSDQAKLQDPKLVSDALLSGSYEGPRLMSSHGYLSYYSISEASPYAIFEAALDIVKGGFKVWSRECFAYLISFLASLSSVSSHVLWAVICLSSSNATILKAPPRRIGTLNSDDLNSVLKEICVLATKPVKQSPSDPKQDVEKFTIEAQAVYDQEFAGNLAALMAMFKTRSGVFVPSNLQTALNPVSSNMIPHPTPHSTGWKDRLHYWLKTQYEANEFMNYVENMVKSLPTGNPAELPYQLFLPATTLTSSRFSNIKSTMQACTAMVLSLSVGQQYIASKPKKNVDQNPDSLQPQLSQPYLSQQIKLFPHRISDSSSSMVHACENLVKMGHVQHFEKIISDLFPANPQLSNNSRSSLNPYENIENIVNDPGESFQNSVGKRFMDCMSESLSALKQKVIDPPMILPSNIDQTLVKLARESLDEAMKVWRTIETEELDHNPVKRLSILAGSSSPFIPSSLIRSVLVPYINRRSQKPLARPKLHRTAPQKLVHKDDPKSALIHLMEAYLIYICYMRKYMICLDMITPELIRSGGKITSRHPLYLEFKTVHGQGWDIDETPEWLLLEWEQGIMIREIQAQVAHAMADHPMEKIKMEIEGNVPIPSSANTTSINNSNSSNNGITQVEFSGRCLQLNMGEGKTSVILPAICMTLACRGVLPRVISIPSQSEIMREAMILKLGSMLQRPVYSFPFNRETPLRKDLLKSIITQLHDCKDKGGIILANPEHILAFQLKYELLISTLTNPNHTVYLRPSEIYVPDMVSPFDDDYSPRVNKNDEKNKNNENSKKKLPYLRDVEQMSNSDIKSEMRKCAMLMEEVRAFWKQEMMEVLDESDELLRHKFQLVYPIGLQQDVAGGSKRWLVNEAVLELLSNMMPSIISKLGPKDSIFIEHHPYDPSKQPDRWGMIRIHGVENVKAVLNSSIAEAILDGYGPPWAFNNIKLRSLSPDSRQLVLNMMIDPSTDATLEGIESLDTKSQDDLQNAFAGNLDTLYLLRGLLCTNLLAHILTLRHSVDYGIRHTSSAGGNQKNTGRKVYSAVPFIAKDTASPRSEFEHVDVMILTTLISYYTSGLSYKQFITCIENLQSIADPALRQAEFDEWISYYKNNNDNTKNIHQSSGNGTANDGNGIVFPNAPSIVSVGSIDITDDEAMTDLYSKIRYNRAMIRFWLNREVFPKETMQFPFKLVASSPDLVPSKVYRSIGFSGTNDTRDLLPSTTVQKEVPLLVHTNATAINLVVQQAIGLSKQMKFPDSSNMSPSSSSSSILASASSSTESPMMKNSSPHLVAASTPVIPLSSSASSISSSTSTPSIVVPPIGSPNPETPKSPKSSPSQHHHGWSGSLSDLLGNHKSGGVASAHVKHGLISKSTPPPQLNSAASGDSISPRSTSPRPSSTPSIYSWNESMEVHELKAGMTGAEILEELFRFCSHCDKSGRDPRALIDSGALIVGMSNIEVAKYLLSVLPSHSFDGVLYFEGDFIMTLDRQSTSVPFSLSPFSSNMSRVFVYLDDHHTRGTDIKMPLHTHAWVTLGPMMNKDKFLQACARLRQMGAGQTACFIAGSQEYSQLKRFCKIKSTDDGSTQAGVMERVGIREIILWCISNSIFMIQKAMPVWAEQNLRHIRNTLIDKGLSEPGLFMDLVASEERHDLSLMYGPPRKEDIGSLIMNVWLDGQLSSIGQMIERTKSSGNPERDILQGTSATRSIPIRNRCSVILSEFKMVWSGNLALSEQEREVEQEAHKEQEDLRKEGQFDWNKNPSICQPLIDLVCGKQVSDAELTKVTQSLQTSLTSWSQSDFNQSVGWDKRIRVTKDFLNPLSRWSPSPDGDHPAVRIPSFVLFIFDVPQDSKTFPQQQTYSQIDQKIEDPLIHAFFISASEADQIGLKVLSRHKVEPGLALCYVAPRNRICDQDFLFFPIFSNLPSSLSILDCKATWTIMSQISLYAGSTFFTYDQRASSLFSIQNQFDTCIPRQAPNSYLGLQIFLGIFIPPSINSSSSATGQKENNTNSSVSSIDELRTQWRLMQDNGLISPTGFLVRDRCASCFNSNPPAKPDWMTPNTFMILSSIYQGSQAQLDPTSFIPDLALLRGNRQLNNTDLVSFTK